MFLNLLHKFKSYTLVELLITLVIIGVVTVLVVPTVISTLQGYAYKRAHMVFNRKLETSLQLMQGSNAVVGYRTTEAFVDQFRKYIKIAKICDNNHLQDCFPDSLVDATGKEIVTENGLTLKNFVGLEDDSSLDTNVMGLILQDGTSILLAYHTDCANDSANPTAVNLNCFSLVYDINGGSKPNKLGAIGRYDANLGTQEDNSNIGIIKDAGLYNAPKYGVPLVVDVTPLNQDLIPVLTSMSSSNGVVTGASTANSTYKVTYNSSAQSALSNYAYRIFNPSNSGTTFEGKTSYASEITYTLHPSMYNNGCFDPGTYTFRTSNYGNNLDNNAQVQFIFYVKNEENQWIQIRHFIAGYPKVPYTSTFSFNVNYKFKGFKMQKTNTTNYVHTRAYQRYNTNLVRTAKE